MKNPLARGQESVLKDYLLISFGIILTAASIVYVFNPNRLAAGGAQGIALVINFYTGINTGLLMIAINILLFATAFLLIGRSFGAKTLFASLGLSSVVYLMERFLPLGPLTEDPMLAAIFGSTLMGVGVGLILNRNASIGGTSLIGKILSKFLYLDQVNSIVATDLVVTMMSMVVFGLEVGLYQLISVYICGLVINRVIDGISNRREVMIITEKRELVMDYIITQMQRGATLLKGRGGYSGVDTEIIYTILTRREFIKLKIFIRQLDSKAFISVNTVSEVSGAGYDTSLGN